MTINARSEMDLDEDTIMEKVAKASGANFSFHKEKARVIPEQGPVVSTRLIRSHYIGRIFLSYFPLTTLKS